MNGVLLDIDGTLIDSNDAHAQAWVEALEEANIPVRYAEVRSKIGQGGDRLLMQVAGLSDESAEGKELVERRGEIFREKYFPRLKAFPGALELLELIRKRGMRMAVATSGNRDDAKALLSQAGLAGVIEELVSADDASSTKPSPAILDVALAKLGLKPARAIMLGDTPYDVEAARRAGVQAVAFTCGGWPPDALKGAVAIYQGPWELLSRFDESPFLDL